MGNSNGAPSSAHVDVDPFVQILEYGYNALRCGNEHVTQEQFERLFSCLSAEQSATLWTKLFSGNSLVDLETYANSVRNLESVRNDEARIRFVMSLVNTKEASIDGDIPYISKFVEWCSSVNSFNHNEVTEIVQSMNRNFLPLDEGNLPSVDSFVRWCVRHCPELSHDLCSCITESLRCGQPILPLNEKLKKSIIHSSINPTIMWLLSNSLVEKFKCNRLKEGGRILDKFNLEKMSHIHRLFDSDEHGLSSSRLQYLVFDYEAPTLMFIQFPDQTYCLALDSAFKEDWSQFGGTYTTLFSVKPKFCRLLSGEKLVYCNFSTKTGKRCIAVGRNAIDAPVVVCDDGLSSGSVFGLQQKVVRVEVWGCGADAEALLRKQAEIKEWERKEAARQRDRKIKGEAWEDSPDRAIMEWGGVNAKHSEMAGAEPEEDE